MSNRNRTGTLITIGVLLTIVSGPAFCETFQFPEFVAVEGDAAAACGGWIIDKVLRPHVLTTAACVKRGSRSVRQLLVRYGSAEVTSRTSSLAIDRMLTFGEDERLVVLSTFGRLRRNPPVSAPTDQRLNGTSLLCWQRTTDGALQKTLLKVAPDQKNTLKHLIDTLHCRDSETGEYHLEGALIMENLIPAAMLTVRTRDESSICGSSVDILELSDLSSASGDARSMIDTPLVEPVPDNGFPLDQPNSPFGYIVYVIFMGYCILYTLMFFIYGLMRTNPSTDL
uniref:Peptidase S1 domain-containing protein n=1 Tax=Anopheles coluzzii TaxID=1518534 RepID=A0A8W7Q2N3_ANOCL